MVKTQFIDKLIEDLLQLGVRPGGVLMVHPALRPFEYIPGGANTIIDGLLRIVGTSGTLLMPALSWENVTPQKPMFDLQDTPSCVGLIAETFRRAPHTIRSMHPTHSVCAVGRQAIEITEEHGLDETPCGPHSPFHKLPKYNGQILMLACGLIYNTSMHAIEELVEPPYLYDPPICYTMMDNHQKSYKKIYRPHNFRGWRQRYDRITNLLYEPALRSGLVVGVLSHLINARKLWKESLPALTSNPLYFVDRIQR